MPEETLRQLDEEAAQLKQEIRLKYPITPPMPWPEELKHLQSRLWEIGFFKIRLIDNAKRREKDDVSKTTL